MNVQDKIEREMVINASPDKVWDAITKPELLVQWFPQKIDVNTLAPGQEFTFGWATEGVSSRAIVETMEPKTHFAYSWESSHTDKNTPFAEAPKTLVTFMLEDANGKTRLTMTETGFSGVPNPLQKLQENTSGWDTELGELKSFVEAA
jgi:uncharacterized protein YndB with AHSA1/START domain